MPDNEDASVIDEYYHWGFLVAANIEPFDQQEAPAKAFDERGNLNNFKKRNTCSFTLLSSIIQLPTKI